MSHRKRFRMALSVLHCNKKKIKKMCDASEKKHRERSEQYQIATTFVVSQSLAFICEDCLDGVRASTIHEEHTQTHRKL